MANTDLVLRVQSTLTDRDHRLLGWLYDHGVLTTGQITDALFGSLDFCQRRLLKLTTLGVITRFRPQKPDGGSYPYHYVIDQLGAEVVAAQPRDDPPRKDHARTRRHHLTSKANLPHLLATNQFFINLARYERTHPGARLATWDPVSRFARNGGFYQRGDDPQVMLLPPVRPDGHGIWVQDGRTVPFLLETDLGTERLTILIDKIDRYIQVANHTNRRWPVLLWLPTAARELHLHQQLAAEFTHVDIPVATAARDHTTATGLSPAEAVWWLHGRQGTRLPLAALPVSGGQDEPT
jgi:hypothetical protein